MTTETETAADIRYAAQAASESLNRARGTVDELHDVVTSALLVLNEAEIDSAKSRLSERGDFYLEAAADHMGRLRNRCDLIGELAEELTANLRRAGSRITDANEQVNELRRSPDRAVADDAATLATKVAVLAEVLDLAQPVTTRLADHARNAAATSRACSPEMLLQTSGGLEHRVREAVHELGRGAENFQMLDTVLTRANGVATRTQMDAEELSETTHGQMPEHRGPPPASGGTRPMGPAW